METALLDTIPVNSNATPEARELLQYLARCSGTSILTGQHTQTNPMEEYQYIHEVTGHYPKVVGFEMLSYSGNINWEDASEACLTEVRENQHTILTICFHWFSPMGGRDKAFYTEHTDFDPTKILQEGSAEEAAFYRDLKSIGEELRKFAEAGIPILWRPFHEVEGTWFWWGSKGGEVAAKLYRKMYHYFVDELALNNLLWVWSAPTKEAYPGDEYVDVIGWDIYLPEKKATDYASYYEELRANTTTHKARGSI